MYYVYIMKSKHKNWVYIGITSDLRKRFYEHNSGKVKSTKGHKPFFLAYYEAYRNKKDAIIREIELKKKGQQKEFLMERIKNSLGSQPFSLRLTNRRLAVDQP